MPRRFDNGWTLDWFEDRLKGREETLQHIADICSEMGCKTILDVGGGPGLMRRFLSKDIKLDVVDLSHKAKLFGEPLFPDVQFITGTIDDINKSYDAIIAISVIEHMNGYESFLMSAFSKTKKVLIATFRNGLDENEDIHYYKYKKVNNYWENKYSFSKLKEWMDSNLFSSRMEVIKVDVNRNYSPELVMVIYKG